MSKVEMVDGARDYRLMTRQVVDNILKLIEINPRIQGSAIVTYYAGSNFPYFEIKYRLGETIDFSKEIKTVKIESIVEYAEIGK